MACQPACCPAPPVPIQTAGTHAHPARAALRRGGCARRRRRCRGCPAACLCAARASRSRSWPATQQSPARTTHRLARASASSPARSRRAVSPISCAPPPEPYKMQRWQRRAGGMADAIGGKGWKQTAAPIKKGKRGQRP
eukprot:107135-Chlamydomonas_euryale.AAC.3